MVATLILSSAYQGVLTSLLAIPKVEIPVDSPQDLVDYGKIPWATERGTSLHQFIGDTKSGIYKVVNDKGFLITASYDGRHRMNVEKFAILCDFFSMRKIMSDDYSETGQCNYYIAKEPILVSSVAFAFPKKSSIIPHFNRLVTMLKEGGIISRYIQDFTANATVCMVRPGKEDGVSTLVLSLADFGGFFLLCRGGYEDNAAWNVQYDRITIFIHIIIHTTIFLGITTVVIWLCFDLNLWNECKGHLFFIEPNDAKFAVNIFPPIGGN
ncbi:uncharacterized protein LOC135226127 [Macrobrachium nipponense]|uniref:uncharacterized protein LOC135226127 n=1 Tax=Macrobrachium nipponense TaxID=159736 RepID=UPI0030C8B837